MRWLLICVMSDDEPLNRTDFLGGCFI